MSDTDDLEQRLERLLGALNEASFALRQQVTQLQTINNIIDDARDKFGNLGTLDQRGPEENHDDQS